MTEATAIKKRLSPDLLKVINRVLEEYTGLFSIRDEKPYELYIADKDSSSDFFFGITKESSDKNGHYVEYSRKPYSSVVKTAGGITQRIDTFENNLKEWFINLKVYNEPSAIDDLLLKGYQEEFFNDFKIVDEDADRNGFEYSQQLKLVEYLTAVSEGLEDLKDDKNSTIIEEIKEDAQNLVSDITLETKNGTMKRISSLFAKARKGGLKVSSFMIKEFAKEFLKDAAKSAFNFAAKHAHEIPQYINQFITQMQLPS